MMDPAQRERIHRRFPAEALSEFDAIPDGA
jgi:hypothetical protein